MHLNEQVDHFCEAGDQTDLTHDETLPTKHNALCGRRSTWEVISTNDDFPEAFIPGTSDQVPDTEFQVLRPTAATRFVLALDKSGSMTEGQTYPSRLDRLKMAAARWIRKGVRDGSQVGVTAFR